MQGGLRAPTHVGVGQSTQEAIHSQWDTFDEMEAMLAKQGFSPETKPQCSCPKITAQIMSDANDRQYRDIYYNLGEWYGYASNLLARIKAKLLEVQNEKGDLKTDLELGAKKAANAAQDKKPTAKDLDIAVRKDPRYHFLTIEEQKLEQQKLILDSKVNTIYRNLKIVSRQVEIRRQEREIGRTGENMGYRAPPPGRI